MDREANYVAVGAFVLLILVMGAGFVLWYTDSADRQQERRYEIYFEGGVFGLSEGGSVRYLGVAVGRVARIDIDPRDRAACESSPTSGKTRRSRTTRSRGSRSRA